MRFDVAHRWPLIALLAGAMCCAQPAAAAAAASTPPSPSGFKLEVDADQRVSLSGGGVSLRLVLSALSRQTGLKFYLPEAAANREVSSVFDRLPLDRALRRLLRSMSYAMVHDPATGRVAEVRVLSTGSGLDGGGPSRFVAVAAPEPTPAPAQSAAPSSEVRELVKASVMAVDDASQQAAVQALAERLATARNASDRVLALEGLAEWLGRPVARDALIGALKDPDAGVRQRALSIMEFNASEPFPIGPLTEVALGDADSSVRERALSVLAYNYPPGDVLELIKSLVNDPSPGVSAHAKRLLSEIDR